METRQTSRRRAATTTWWCPNPRSCILTLPDTRNKNKSWPIGRRASPKFHLKKKKTKITKRSVHQWLAFAAIKRQSQSAIDENMQMRRKINNLLHRLIRTQSDEMNKFSSRVHTHRLAEMKQWGVSCGRHVGHVTGPAGLSIFIDAIGVMNAKPRANEPGDDDQSTNSHQKEMNELLDFGCCSLPPPPPLGPHDVHPRRIVKECRPFPFFFSGRNFQMPETRSGGTMRTGPVSTFMQILFNLIDRSQMVLLGN